MPLLAGCKTSTSDQICQEAEKQGRSEKSETQFPLGCPHGTVMAHMRVVQARLTCRNDWKPNESHTGTAEYCVTGQLLSPLEMSVPLVSRYPATYAQQQLSLLGALDPTPRCPSAVRSFQHQNTFQFSLLTVK